MLRSHLCFHNHSKVIGNAPKLTHNFPEFPSGIEERTCCASQFRRIGVNIMIVQTLRHHSHEVWWDWMNVAFYDSPEPRPLRYSRSVCKRDGRRRDAEDIWFWIGRPFASTSMLVSVGHKTRSSDILTNSRKEVVHICSFDFAANTWEWCAAVNMSLKYAVIWWKQTTVTLKADCETIDRLSVACHSQVVSENNQLPIGACRWAINNIIQKIVDLLRKLLLSDMAYVLMDGLGVRGLGNKVGGWWNVWPHGGSGRHAAAGRHHRIQHVCLSRECRLKKN